MVHPDGSRHSYTVDETTTTEDALAYYRQTTPDTTGLVMGSWRLEPGRTLFSARILEGISVTGWPRHPSPQPTRSPRPPAPAPLHSRPFVARPFASKY